jgi:hypothetical protein
MRPSPMHQSCEVAVVSAASSEDYWTLYSLEHGGEMRTSSPTRFYSFLLSPGTQKARIEAHNPGKLKVRLLGPRCDDGEYIELAAFLSADTLHLALSQEEKRNLQARLLELWGPPYAPFHPLTLVKNALKL